MKTNNLTTVNFANVHWFTTDNIRIGDASWGNPMADIDYREEFLDEKQPELGKKVVSEAKPGEQALVYNMRDGWDATQGVCSVVKADDKMVKAAIEDRQAVIKQYEQKPDTASLAVMLREIWFPQDGKSYKPVKPEYIANNCYRRSRGIMGVLLRRKRDTPANWDTTYIVPVDVKDFGSGEAGELARLANHILENTMKTAGRKELQPIDYFFQAVKMRKLKGDKMRESDLVALHIKRGEAQRAFALVTLDARFSELNIQQRAMLPPPSPYMYVRYKSYLDVSRLRHADLVRLVGNKHPTDKNDKTYSRTQILQMTEEYFRDSMGGSKPPVITSRQVIDTAKNSPCVLLQYLSKKLEVNSEHWSNMFNEQSKEINKALKFLAKHDELYAAIQAEVDKVSE